MKTGLKRWISLVLVVMMFLSLGEMPAFAANSIREYKRLEAGDNNRDWDTELEVPDLEVRPFPGLPEGEGDDLIDIEDDWEMPAQSFRVEDEELGVIVTAEAPAGALPANSTMEIYDSIPADYEEALQELGQDEPEVLLALIVAFYNEEGEFVHPQRSVQMKVTAAALAEGAGSVAMIPEETAIDPEPKALELIRQDELSFVLASDEIVFNLDACGIIVAMKGVTAPVDPIEEPMAMPAQHFDVIDGDMVVTVDAPENALPAGTTLDVYRVLAEDYQDEVNALVAGSPDILLALNITFYDEFGAEIEPQLPVQVKITAPELEGQANLSVVHIPDADDAADPETVAVVEPENLDFELGTNEVVFQSDKFSVYAVIGSASVRLTVEFYTSDAQDATLISQQVLVLSQFDDEGEKPLVDPGVPELGEKQSFEGWMIDETHKNLDINGLNAYIHDNYASMTANATLRVNAMIYDVRYVIYRDQSGAVLKTDSFHVHVINENQVESTDVLISYEYTPFKGGQNLAGWIKTDYVDIAGDYPLYFEDDIDTVYPNNQEASLNETIDLSPYLKTGTWLIFDTYKEQDDDPTSTSFVPPAFVEEGANTVAPTKPTRTGYDFDGWYTDKSFSQRFIFGSPLNSDTTIYAKWKAKMTTYTVVFWQQNVTDAVDAADADKTYSFYAAEERGALTGSSVSLILSDSGTAADNRRGGNSTDSIGEMGFYFSYNAANSDTSSKVVNGNGSTVLNVYYDRKVITFNFYGSLTSYNYSSSTYNTNYPYYGRNNSGNYFKVTRSGGYWYDASNTRYTGTVYHLTFSSDSLPYNDKDITYGSIQGLYGATMDSYTWDFASTISGNKYPYSGQYLMWHDSTTGRYTNKAFQFTTGEATTATSIDYYLNEYQVSSTTRPYTCLGQDTSGNFTITLDDASMKSTETLYLSGDEYFGYVLDRYNKTSNNYNSATVWDGKEISCSYNDIGNGGHAYFYYARNKWDFVFESNSQEVKTEQIYWEGDLSDLASYVPTNGPAGYFFDGWYADSAFDTLFDFSQEMPNHNVKVYAKWTLMRFRVVCEPRGDDLTIPVSEITIPNDQATTFRINYGEAVEGTNFNAATRPGYTLLGWFLDTDPDNDTVYDTPFNFSTPMNDSFADLSYANASAEARQGVDPWKDNKAYNDADGEHDDVIGKITIYAKWRQDPDGIIGINVRYDAVESDEHKGYFSGDAENRVTTRDDSNIYADRAQAYAQPASTPEQYDPALKFLYWDILDKDGNSTGRKAYPGQTFEIHAEDAVVEDIIQVDPEPNLVTFGDQIPKLVMPGDAELQGEGTSGNREVQTLTTTLFSDNFDDGTAFTTSTSASDTMSTETWTAYNVGSGNNWSNNNNSSYAHSGSRSARYQYNSYYAANCYLISKPFKVSSTASALNVSLWERVRNGSYAETFEVFFIITDGVTTNGAAVSATHYNVISSANYTNTTYAQKSGAPADLSALAGKNVRLVIHCTSAADRYELYIDDVNVTETKTGETVTYELVNAPVAGKDYVIVVGDTHAVTNSTYTGNRYVNALSVVNNGDDTITFFASEESSLLYRAGGSASGWTFYNQAAGSYLGLNASDYHYLSMTADPWEWLYTGTDLDNQWTGEDNVNSNGDAWRYLGYDVTYDDFTTMISTGQNVKFYKAPISTYTVTFVDSTLDESDPNYVIATAEVEEGGSATAPQAPDHSDMGLIFSGWSDAFDNVTEDLTISAIYSDQSSLHYQVTFRYMDAEGNWVTETQTVDHGQSATAPTLPTPPAGYTFNSWDKRFDQVTSNMVINAVYKQEATKKYVITLRAVYGRADAGSVTHINWYSNAYDLYDNEVNEQLITAKALATLKTELGLTGGSGGAKEETVEQCYYEGGDDSKTYDARDGYNFYYDYVKVVEDEMPIPVPYLSDDYEFLGWGRVSDASSIPEGHQASEYLTNPDDLDANNLYLKYVKDDTAAGYHFDTFYEGEWRTVTAVAADEEKPYHDMYAVWKPTGSVVWYSNLQDVALNDLASASFTKPEDATLDQTNGWFIKDSKLSLDGNGTEVPIPAFDTYTYGTDGLVYHFLGWATDPDATEPDIKWVEGTDGAAGHYETNTRAAETVTTVKVTKDDYNADTKSYTVSYYALWQTEFYIYHSGIDASGAKGDANPALETIPLTRGTFDLASRTTDGMLYGGYYLDGGFTVTGEYENLRWPKYDGTNWTWTSAESADGMAMTPVGGQTYYIKEVPADKFLMPYMHYTYYLNEEQSLATAWLISGVDDLNYSETGFVIVTDNEEADGIVKSLKVTANNTGTSITLTPKRVFKSTGYLTYSEVFDCHNDTNALNNGNKVLQYWITPDGILVTGNMARVYTGLDGGVPDLSLEATTGNISFTDMNQNNSQDPGNEQP